MQTRLSVSLSYCPGNVPEKILIRLAEEVEQESQVKFCIPLA